MSLTKEFGTTDSWFILKGETKIGPYTYEGMISLLQKNLVYDFDYVWASHMDNWAPISNLPEFSQDRILRIFEKSNVYKIFSPRGKERVFVKIPIYAHNEKQMWRGEVTSISEGGALILMDNPLLLPEDNITVHFKSSFEAQRPFLCLCSILSKKYLKDRIEHDTQIRYVVRFIGQTESGKKEISRLISNEKSKNTK